MASLCACAVTLLYSTCIGIMFEETFQTVTEGDGAVDVCIITSCQREASVAISVESEDGSAQG